MKLHRPVTSAFPVAIAAASIALSLALIPGGGTSVSSSGVAPALRLAAGEVAAVVETPVHAVTSPHHRSVAPPAVGSTGARTPVTQQASSRHETRTVPTHRSAGHRKASPPPRTSTKRQVTVLPTTPPPQPIAPAVEHGHGKALGHTKKAKAWGHVQKPKASGHAKKAKARGHVHKPKPVPPPATVTAATQPTATAKSSHGHAYGHALDLPHGPPAVPPGQERGGKK